MSRVSRQYVYQRKVISFKPWRWQRLLVLSTREISNTVSQSVNPCIVGAKTFRAHHIMHLAMSPGMRWQFEFPCSSLMCFIMGYRQPANMAAFFKPISACKACFVVKRLEEFKLCSSLCCSSGGFIFVIDCKPSCTCIHIVLGNYLSEPLF